MEEWRLTLMINSVFDGARRVPFLYFTGDSLKNSFGQRSEGVVLRTLLLALLFCLAGARPLGQALLTC